MAFPLTPLLDDFNRADSGPPLGSNWTTGVTVGAGGLKVVSNTARPALSVPSDTWWNVQMFGPTCEAYAKIAALSGSAGPFLFLRLVSTGTNFNGYSFHGYGTSGTASFIARVEEGTETQLGASWFESLSVGDSVGFRASGSTLTAYNIISGVDSVVATRDDSTYITSGYIGLGGSSATQAIDEFGGGEPVAPQTGPGKIGMF